MTLSGRRVVIVGGVAGGMSTATRLRRLDEEASIVVLERSGHVSYANCGLPYFVGGVIEDQDDLLLQTPERLFDRFRLDVHVDTEVVAIDPVRHTVTVPFTGGGVPSELPYDKRSSSVRAPRPCDRRCPGSIGSACSVRSRTPSCSPSRHGAAPRTAVVIGAGFVGLETAENHPHREIRTTVVEAADQVLTPLDPRAGHIRRRPSWRAVVWPSRRASVSVR